jgi:hypothetical protein
MKRPIRLFVSSSPELTIERELLGQVIAEMPIALGWEIMHTPGPGTDMQDVLEFIDTSDFYLIVLGWDFAAPMGVEWEEAVTSGRVPFALRKNVLHTLAGRHLLAHSGVRWIRYQTPQDFARKVRHFLIGEILDRGEAFGLLTHELDALLLALKRDGEVSVAPDEAGGAGSDAVILDRRGPGSGRTRTDAE